MSIMWRTERERESDLFMYSFDMRVGPLRGVTVDVSTVIMTIIPRDHDHFQDLGPPTGT